MLFSGAKKSLYQRMLPFMKINTFTLKLIILQDKEIPDDVYINVEPFMSQQHIDEKSWI